jgi:hypothetical protein
MWCSKATNEWLVLREYAGELKARDLGVPTADAVESSRWARWRPSINPAERIRDGQRTPVQTVVLEEAVSLGPPISGGR